jgi:phospholipid/cholesterol/gamma-HCH transport system substrate-binding protein
LLGGKYIGLSPGGLDTFLKDGSQIEQTQSAIVLENLINKLFANYASSRGSNGGEGQGASQDNDHKDTQNRPEPRK